MIEMKIEDRLTKPTVAELPRRKVDLGPDVEVESRTACTLHNHGRWTRWTRWTRWSWWSRWSGRLMTTYWGCIRRQGVSEKKEDDETWGKAQSGRAEERLEYNQPFLLNNGVQRSSHQKIWEREGNCGKWRGHQRPRLHSAVAQGEEVLVIQKHLDIHSERLVYKRETILFTVTARFAHWF